MFSRILVGLDGSAASRLALEQALALAKHTGGTVTALSVEERLPVYAATVGEVQDEDSYKNDYFRKIHDEARRLAAARGVPLETEIASGHAAAQLIRVAGTGGHDLLVLGHTGHSRLHHLFLGSTADRVVEHAPCPVLVTR
jgi:nucleotide-binding universal stress UspA family protein